MPQHILHISDLHFGADHGFLMPGDTPRPGEIEIDIADAIASDLEVQGIEEVAAVIISGDLVTHARWVDNGQRAYETLKKFCHRTGLETKKVFIVPGNHDYEWYFEDNGQILRKALQPNKADQVAVNFGHVVQFNNFLRQLHGADSYELPSVHILPLPEYTLKIGLLDSCKITATQFHEYGYLSLGQIKALTKGFEDNIQSREVRVAVLHHHLTSVIPAEPPNDELSVSVTLDAARLIDYALPSGISLFLHGHQHYPCISRINKSHTQSGVMCGLGTHDIYILSGGSAGVKRERLMAHVPNTYSVIAFGSVDATVRIRRIYSNGTEGSTYLEAAIPLHFRGK